MKRVISMVLCLMLVLSLATTAFAEETTTKYEYEIFQIFTGTFEENVLTDVKWGQNGKLPEGGKVGDVVADAVLEALEEVDASASNETKLATILTYADLTGTAYQTLNTNDTTASMANLPDGYYLVRDKANSQNGENEYYTTYIVKVVDGTLSITRKGDAPGVDKVIVEDNTDKKENEVSIGDIVNYKFTGSMPTNIADYDTYFYKFNDTLSAGLTITDTDAETVGIQTDVKVTVNNVDVTKYFYINAEVQTDGTTKLVVACTDIIALEKVTDVTVGDITTDTKVVVTYTAVLNENAIVGTNGNKNDVDLEYSNDPNDDGDGSTNPPDVPEEEPESERPTGVTPKSEVWTYTTEIQITKKDQDGKVLTGAAFTITGEGVNMVVTTGEVYVAYGADETVDTANCYWLLKNGTYTTQDPAGKITNEAGEEVAVDTSVYQDTTTKYHKETKVTIDGETEGIEVEAFVDSNGIVKFTGLGAGTYTITESVVPEGYNSIDPITVEITWAQDTAGNGCTWTYKWSNDTDNTNNSSSVTIVNQAGSTLPETGGMGTTLFYVLGSVMVLAAVVLLVTKKRMGAAE